MALGAVVAEEVRKGSTAAGDHGEDVARTVARRQSRRSSRARGASVSPPFKMGVAYAQLHIATSTVISK